MVYKGAKHIRFIASASVNSVGYANRTGVSLYAKQADKLGVSNVMSAKRSAVSSATTVAQNVASLTNQAGGNIGFTYE